MKLNKEYTVIFKLNFNSDKEEFKIKKINEDYFIAEYEGKQIKLKNLTSFKNLSINEKCKNCKMFSVCQKQIIYNNINFDLTSIEEKIILSILIKYLNESRVCKENENIKKKCGNLLKINYFQISDDETGTIIFQKGIE